MFPAPVDFGGGSVVVGGSAVGMVELELGVGVFEGVFVEVDELVTVVGARVVVASVVDFTTLVGKAVVELLEIIGPIPFLLLIREPPLIAMLLRAPLLSV
jgi:hypothetical protein